MANNSVKLDNPGGVDQQQKGKMDWADTQPSGQNPAGGMEATRGDAGDRDDDDFDASMSMSVTAANKQFGQAAANLVAKSSALDETRDLANASLLSKGSKGSTKKSKKNKSPSKKENEGGDEDEFLEMKKRKKEDMKINRKNRDKRKAAVTQFFKSNAENAAKTSIPDSMLDLERTDLQATIPAGPLGGSKFDIMQASGIVIGTAEREISAAARKERYQKEMSLIGLLEEKSNLQQTQQIKDDIKRREKILEQSRSKSREQGLAFERSRKNTPTKAASNEIVFSAKKSGAPLPGSQVSLQN